MCVIRSMAAALALVFLVGCEQQSAEPQRTATKAEKKDWRSDSDNAGTRLLASLEKGAKPPAQALAFEFDEALSKGDAKAETIAQQLLGATHEIVKDAQAAAYIEGVATEHPAAAAKLLAWTARAQQMSQMYGPHPYAIGRLVLPDSDYSVTDVMAQVPITAEGYFASEIGDPKRPLSFRAPGFEDLDARLDGGDQAEVSESRDPGASKEGDAAAPTDAIVLGDVAMKRLAADKLATLHGRVALDDASKAGSAEIQMSLGVAEPNTPHGGYSPRRSWPKGQSAKVGEDRSFEITGLNPTSYSVTIAADDHAPKREKITLAAGEVHDAGELRLRSTNLDFYIGAKAPEEVGEMPWEANYDAALARAQRENKPLMVMMTATWCQPCKMLEKDCLGNAWLRKFLEPFVVVQAFEDKAVEKKYGLRGYPTLVFCNSAGEEASRMIGYRPPIDFAADVARGLRGVNLDLPAELQKLVDDHVVEAAN